MKLKTSGNISIHFLTILFQIEIFKSILLIYMAHYNHIVKQHRITNIYRHLLTIKFHKYVLRAPGIMTWTFILISWQNMMDTTSNWIRRIKQTILCVIVEKYFRKLKKSQCSEVRWHTLIHMDQMQLVIKFYLSLRLDLINLSQLLKELLWDH